MLEKDLLGGKWSRREVEGRVNCLMKVEGLGEVTGEVVGEARRQDGRKVAGAAADAKVEVDSQ